MWAVSQGDGGFMGPNKAILLGRRHAQTDRCGLASTHKGRPGSADLAPGPGTVVLPQVQRIPRSSYLDSCKKETIIKYLKS